MKQKILFVSHCLLNDGTKLKNQDPTEMESERREKRKLLHTLLDAGVELVQLPCPEFILYGAKRWDMRHLSLTRHFSEKNQEIC